MPANAPQAKPEWAIKPKGNKLIADIGSGPESPYMVDEGDIISFDIREDVHPSVVCDVRKLPVPDQTFDTVFSSHTLEHFGWTNVDKVLKEWCRVLKVGGQLKLVVPNLRYVGKRILSDELQPQDLWVMYGEQDYPKNMHGTGFTPKMLRGLVESLGIFENIEVNEGEVDGPPNPRSWNLYLNAVKVKHPKVDNITPEWADAPPRDEQWWPMRMYQQYNERPMTNEEKAADVAKWITSTEPLIQSPDLMPFAPGGREVPPIASNDSSPPSANTGVLITDEPKRSTPKKAKGKI
jgi:predicted SAM-dependent methyltransferase